MSLQVTWDWLAQWFPALRTGLVLAIMGAIFGPLYKSWVERGVQSKFDQQLERLRSQLRQEEEASKAKVKRVDEQLGALRSSVLSSMNNRQAAFDKRRIEAVDKFWITVLELRPLKSLLIITQTLKMEEVLKAASEHGPDGDAMRKFLATIWDVHELEKIKGLKLPDTERPYLSPLAWAAFKLYSQILYFPFTQVALGRLGAGLRGMKDSSELLTSVGKALPHHVESLATLGTGALPNIVEELEQVLLDQLLAGVSGQDADQKLLEQAKNLVATIAQHAPTIDPGLQALVPESLRRH